MIKYFLMIDYSLSYWLARRDKESALNGTAYFFLTKVGFFIQSLFFIILPLLPTKFSIESVVIFFMVLNLFLMYGFPKAVKNILIAKKIPNLHKKVAMNTKRKRNLLASLYLLLFFSIMFVVGVIHFEGYANG